MKTYVLGAGASLHAGYPLASNMGTELFAWLEKRANSRIRDAAVWFQAEFGPVGNIEDLFSQIQTVLDDFRNGTREQKAFRVVTANERPHLVEGLRGWFSEIRNAPATAYRQFARQVIQPGDCIITFNYDVSLDRELRRAQKWDVGDGYGFRIERLPANSTTTLLKLHGSTNWMALLLGGKTGFFQVQGGVFGERPVIAPDELDFLGYCALTDPALTHPSGYVPPMILPTRCKQFFFDTTFGSEWEDFWNGLWAQAEKSLMHSEEVCILGYSLAPADERASGLLFSAPTHSARIEISSGSDTGRIAEQFRGAGYRDVSEAKDTYFEDWVQAKSAAISG